jgi:hypothetical protein
MRWLPGRRVGVIALGNATYVPMSAMARTMLEIIDDHGLIPPVACAPSAALVDAAHRLAVLLSDWSDVDADELFADNVVLDESYTRRAEHAAEMTATHGTLTVVSIDAVTPMRGRATLRHADGTERQIELEMSPLVPPRLQQCEVLSSGRDSGDLALP